MEKIFGYIKRKKYLSFVIVAILIVSAFLGYRLVYGKSDEVTRYITAKPEKKTLSVSVSGSGQVTASNQIDVKPKVSGEAMLVKVKKGQTVKKDDILVQIDTTEALKSVRDAQDSLDNANLSMKKLKEPADALSIMQSENSVQQAKNNLEKLKLSQKTDYIKAKQARQKALDDIESSYEDAFNKIANSFLDMPTIISQLEDYLYGTGISNSEANIGNGQENATVLENTLSNDDLYLHIDKIEKFVKIAKADYSTARDEYNNNNIDYKNTSRYSATSTIELLLDQTIDTAKTMAQALKSQTNMYDVWVDYRTNEKKQSFSEVAKYQSNLSSYISKVNSHLSNLLSAQRSIQDSEDSLVDAEQNIIEMEQDQPFDLIVSEQSLEEKQASLEKLKSGPDELDLQSQETSVRQRQNSLWEAYQKLADYTIKAPFDGIVAESKIKQNETLSSASVVATIITHQKLSVIALNEVEVAKIKIGQKAVLNFDAVEDLSISGKVVEVDMLGTVSQGVVNYNVTIAFDAQDERIKPGMSVSVSIIIQAKSDVLTVPNSAIKDQAGSKYVSVKKGDLVESKQVEVGLSNDISTEIISGLSVDDEVVTQTITANGAGATTAPTGNARTTSNPSSNVGGMMRIMR
ncbi:MAG: efflux RND transporter periplasmic adaptor subunit [bacterium]